MNPLWSTPEPPFPWIADALCTQTDPELFFPHGKGSVTKFMANRAREVCYRCPVIAECRQYAIERPSLQGVWGGTTDEQRRELRKEARSA